VTLSAAEIGAAIKTISPALASLRTREIWVTPDDGGICLSADSDAGRIDCHVDCEGAAPGTVGVQAQLVAAALAPFGEGRVRLEWGDPMPAAGQRV
jgi:hypothetical protein